MQIILCDLHNLKRIIRFAIYLVVCNPICAMIYRTIEGVERLFLGEGVGDEGEAGGEGLSPVVPFVGSVADT